MLPKTNHAPLVRAIVADSGNNAGAICTVKRGANSVYTGPSVRQFFIHTRPQTRQRDAHEMDTCK